MTIGKDDIPPAAMAFRRIQETSPDDGDMRLRLIAFPFVADEVGDGGIDHITDTQPARIDGGGGLLHAAEVPIDAEVSPLPCV